MKNTLVVMSIIKADEWKKLLKSFVELSYNKSDTGIFVKPYFGELYYKVSIYLN